MISDILNALAAAKADTAAAITEKGGTIHDGDGFADFPAAIRALSGAASGEEMENPASPAEILSGFQALQSDGSVMTGTLKMRTGTITPDSIVNSGNTKPIVHNLGVTPSFIMIWTTESLKNVTGVTWPIYWGATSYVSGEDSITKSTVIYYDTQSKAVKDSTATSPTYLATGINATQFSWCTYPNVNYGWPAGVTYHWLVIGT